MLWRAGSGHNLSFSFRDSQFRWISQQVEVKRIPSPTMYRAGRHGQSQDPQTPRTSVSSQTSVGTTQTLPFLTLIRNGHHQDMGYNFSGRVSRSLLSRFPLQTSIFLGTIEKLSSKNAPKNEIIAHIQRLHLEVLETSKSACAFAKELVDRACPERAVHVMHIAHRLETVFSHSQYEQVVHHLATCNYWKHVHSVVVMTREHTGRWTVRLLNWALRSHLETQHYALLDTVLDDFERDQLKPTRRTYQLLVRGYLQNSDLTRARDCLMRMQQAGFEMDKSTYFTVLGAHRPLGPNKAVEAQAFQNLQAIGGISDTALLNGIMQLRIDDGDVSGAIRVLHRFALPPMSSGDHDAGQESGNATASSTPPDNATFNILLAFLARRKGELHNVLRVFRQMTLAGLRADVETAAALILAYATANMPGATIEIVGYMCTCHNIAADRTEFRLSGPAGTVELDVLEALSIRPTTHVFNAFLQVVLPEYGLMGMRKIFRIMRQASILPDASTTQIILSYLHDAQHMRPRSLVHVLSTLADFPMDQTPLSLQHVNIILRAILRRERDIIRTASWSAAAQRVRLGHFSRFSPDRLSRPPATFDPTAGISLASFPLSINKLLDPIVSSLGERQVKSDRMTFALSIRREAVTKLDIKSAERIFDAMVARGIHPTAYHYSALIEGHVEVGNMDSAREVMDRASRAGIAPNVVMYTILIIGYGRMGRPDLAKTTFSEMVSAGVKPDFAAVDAVVSAYWFVRAYGTARGLLLDLWPMVAPFPPELSDASLRVLVQSLRAMRGDSKTIKPLESAQERRRRLRLRRKMGRTLSELKDWRQVLEAVDWAKGDVDLSHMLQVGFPGRVEHDQF